MDICHIPLNEITPYARNPRKIDAAVDGVAASIKEFGFLQPVVIDKDNVIVVGHVRHAAARKLGLDAVPCVRVEDLTEQQVKAYRLLDNKLNEKAEWDDEMPEFDAAGFDAEFDLPDNATAEEDDYEPPEEIQTDIKRGDLIELGPHRVMCEDATNINNWSTADVVFTSPPYNLGVSAKMSGNTAIGNRGNAYEGYDDNQSESEWLKLVCAVTEIAIRSAKSVIINVQSLSGNRSALWSYLFTFKDQFCDVGIWDKGHAAPQQAPRVMNSVFEFVFFFRSDKPNRAIQSGSEFRGTIDNVFRFGPQRSNDAASWHGATMSVDFAAYIISTFTLFKLTILDPFLGSGTTLIAADQLNRICYGIEIEPKYCQVVIDRYKAHCEKSGKEFVCKVNGEAYDGK